MVELNLFSKRLCRMLHHINAEESVSSVSRLCVKFGGQKK